MYFLPCPPDGLRIQRVRHPDDFGVAVELALTEGWLPCVGDIRCAFAADSLGLFVALFPTHQDSTTLQGDRGDRGREAHPQEEEIPVTCCRGRAIEEEAQVSATCNGGGIVGDPPKESEIAVRVDKEVHRHTDSQMTSDCGGVHRPRGRVVEDLQPVGFVYALAYDPPFACLSYWLVLPSHRGRGWGQRLWEHATRYLQHRCGDVILSLDAVEPLRERYMSWGFHPAFQISRWSGSLVALPSAVLSLSRTEEVRNKQDTPHILLLNSLSFFARLFFCF